MFNIDISLLLVVLALILGDVIVGLVKAFALGNFSSSKMREGLWHKAGSVLLLLLAAGVTIACQYVQIFPEEFAVIYVPICAYLAIMEIGSILENIVEINPNLDRFKIFQIFGNNNNNNKDEGDENA